MGLDQIQNEFYTIINSSKNIVVKIFVIKKILFNIKKKELAGTGFYIKNNYIVTNFHVIRKADEVIIESYDKTKYSAKIIGYDEIYDICILKCSKTNFKLLKCNSKYLKEGQFAIAMGMPMGLEFTPTIGVISSLSHSIKLSNGELFDEIIQFSGKLTSGNSGSPLINNNLEIIGMNTYSLFEEDDISFAIKIDFVLKIANKILNESRGKMYEYSY